MDNVLIDRSASGFDFWRWTTDGDGCRSRSFAMMSSLPTPPPTSHSSFVNALPLHSDQYGPYLHSSLSLPPLPPPRRPPLLPLPPRASAATKANKYAVPPPRPALMATASMRRTVSSGEYKRKKPRAPRGAGDEPARAQRRKPLERAAPLPPAPAVDAALDDLEREVLRGVVEDLVHVLAPPPSSLPLPTFSLVKAAAVKASTAAAPWVV